MDNKTKIIINKIVEINSIYKKIYKINKKNITIFKIKNIKII